MHNRAVVIEENLKACLTNGELPQSYAQVKVNLQAISAEKLIEIFESGILSRILDLKTRELRNTGDSFYTIGSSGHELNAVLGHVLRVDDMAFLHYRDAAFMIQRSKELPRQTILYDMLLSFVASSLDPISGGRHKVLGSKELFIPPQTSTIASHLPKAIGAALSIPRNTDLKLKGFLKKDGIIMCSFGDASLNHASAQSAVNTAGLVSFQNIPLPLLFVCEDNGTGISVRTPGGWVKANMQFKPGIKYFSCDGLNICDTYQTAKAASEYVRKMKKPAFLHIKLVRLLGHAGSDIELNYRTQSEVESAEANDPLLHTATILVENKLLTKAQILSLYQQLRQRVDRVAKEVVPLRKLETAQEIKASLIPSGKLRETQVPVQKEVREKSFGREWKKLSNKWQMNKLINFALRDILLQYPHSLIFGEDVARKGGVYNVTHGLSKSFSQKRVFNSPLDETNILGTAIGFAHNGFIPIPEIQFLAYVHNAEDQIRGEAATLSFFSKGQFTNPMVIRIAGLAYQKGFGGHFHNDNSITVFRDLPGVVLACPSNGRDAVLMLRECIRLAHEEGRVCIFLEPIALYQTKDLLEPGDELWASSYPEDTKEMIPFGEMNIVDEKDHELCIVSYGNGFYMSMQAKKILENKYNKKIKVIDLRWLTLIDHKKLVSELEKSKNVLVVDECRKSGSLSEEIMTAMIENATKLPKMARLTGEDCFIPLADAANLVLIQTPDIVTKVLDMLGASDE